MVILDTSGGAIGLWIGVGVAILALAVVAALLVAVLRTRSLDTKRLEAALRESNLRVEGMLSGLTGSLELARTETDRTRRLGEIGATIDLDEVLARTLEAAGTVPLVDAAMLVLPDNGKPIVATMGMTADEAQEQLPAGAPDGRTARAVMIRYQYPDQGTESGDEIRGGLAIPLAGDGEEPIGTLCVFWRGADREPTESQLAEIEELAAAAAPAIENARRFQEARQLADLDALTGLHNYRYFHETLQREVARAHRYDRRLALIVFDIDDFKSINDRVGHLAGDAVLAEAAERIHEVVRGADIACRVGGDEFAVILPESTLEDAENFYRRLQASIASWKSAAVDAIRLSAGIAELRPDDDGISFFKRADTSLYKAKRAGKGRAVSSSSPEAVGMGEPQPAVDPVPATAEPYRTNGDSW